MKQLLNLALALLILGNTSPLIAHDGPHGSELFTDTKHSLLVEMVHDQKGGKVTAYILDGKANKEVPITAKKIIMSIKGKDSVIQLSAANA